MNRNNKNVTAKVTAKSPTTREVSPKFFENIDKIARGIRKDKIKKGFKVPTKIQADNYTEQIKYEIDKDASGAKKKIIEKIYRFKNHPKNIVFLAEIGCFDKSNMLREGIREVRTLKCQDKEGTPVYTTFLEEGYYDEKSRLLTGKKTELNIHGHKIIHHCKDGKKINFGFVLKGAENEFNKNT